MFDHATFLSPLTWRYGSEEMRQIWSEQHKRRLWRRIWVALAEAQAELGLVTGEQLEDLRAHADRVDVDRALEIEAVIGHDLMAEVKAFAEQCPVGGGIIHLGATSTDVEDNADVLRVREALDLVLDRLRALLRSLAGRIDAHSDQVCMGYTHSNLPSQRPPAIAWPNRPGSPGRPGRAATCARRVAGKARGPPVSASHQLLAPAPVALQARADLETG
jgi:adenylosuccinate lyase